MSSSKCQSSKNIQEQNTTLENIQGYPTSFLLNSGDLQIQACFEKRVCVGGFVCVSSEGTLDTGFLCNSWVLSRTLSLKLPAPHCS